MSHKKIVSYGLGSLIVLLGLTVMIGWHIQRLELIQIVPVSSFPPMQYNTALCFLLSGFAALCMQRWHKISGCVSLLIFLISGLTLIEYLMHINIGIDQFVPIHYISTYTTNPGRMAPNTALCFFMVAIAFFCNGFFPTKKWANLVFILLPIIFGLLGMVSIAGYIFNFKMLYGWGNLTGMAIHTAAGFVLIALACIPTIMERMVLFPLLKEYNACIMVGAIGFIVFLISWQILASYQDNQTKSRVDREAFLFKNRLLHDLSVHASIMKITNPHPAITQLVSSSINENLPQNFGVQLSESQKTVFTKKNDATEFFRDQWLVKKEFSLQGTQWSFSIWPDVSYVNAGSSALPYTTFIFGFIMTLLLVVMVRLWQISLKKNKLIELAQKRFLLLIDTSAQAMLLVNGQGKIVLANKQSIELLGYSESQLLAMTVEALMPTEFRHAHVNYRHDYMQKPTIRRMSEFKAFSILTQSGEKIPVEIALTPLEINNEIFVLSTISNISEWKAYEKKLTFMAHHDALTGVANRIQFEEFAKRSLLRAIRNRQFMAIFMIDIDGFKTVNDTLGHETGDLLLQAVSKRILSILRDVDILARLGGDEFAVVIDDVKTESDCITVAEKIVEAMRVPFIIQNINRINTVSIGVAIFPDAGDSIPVLLKNADFALYTVKKSGRNNFSLFKKSDQSPDE